MADINQISSAPLAREKVNKGKKTLSQIIDAAGDYPTSPSTVPWYEKYEWRIGNNLDDTTLVKTKNYDDSTSSPEKTESEKTDVRSIDKVVSKAVKAVKVSARKAAASSTAKNFVKKATKKGIEKSFEAGSEYAMNEIDSRENTAINRKNTGTDRLEPPQKKKKKKGITRHSLHSPSLRRKLKFVDNEDNGSTSPIIIYIYP